MKLVTALALASLAVAAGGVVFAYVRGSDDPYFMWRIVNFAVPPAVIGLLLLAPWRSLRTAAGWLALVLGVVLLGSILALVASFEQQDLVTLVVVGAVYALVAALNLAIFWAAVLRDRGSRTSSPPHSAAA